MIHPLLEAVFHAFDQVDIHWCVLRGEANLSAPAGDVDLLVARGDSEPVRRILEELEFVPLPALGRGSHRFWWPASPHYCGPVLGASRRAADAGRGR